MTSEATMEGVAATAIPDDTVPAAAVENGWARPDGQRMLQLVLGTAWLFDGLLQFQAYFFTRAFGSQMIRGTAAGNPSVIAGPINWAAQTIGNHVAVNTVFALMQIAIGLAIAWRPTVRVGLALSIAWSIGVWWVGEGLGGVLSGNAATISGAPGAVILYALLAVLLWPGERRVAGSPGFVASWTVGARVAKVLWLVLWGSLVYFALTGVNRSSEGLRRLFDSLAPGEPGWLGFLDHHAASLAARHGLAVSVALAVVLAFVAVGVYLPRIPANVAVGTAIGVSTLLWVVGQDFGTLFTNGATDLNSGPLLVLLAVAYWQPARREA